MMRTVLFIASLVGLLGGSAYASSVIAIHGNESAPQNLTSHTQYWFDPQSKTEPPSTTFDGFKQVEKEDITVDYNRGMSWIRLKIKNDSPQPLEKVLFLTSRMAGVVSLFELTSAGYVRRGLSGSDTAWESRAIQAEAAAFSIAWKPKEEKELLLSSQTGHRLDTKVMLASEKAFLMKRNESSEVMAAYLGSIIALFVYNFFLFLYSRSRHYLYYCLFLLSFGMTAVNVQAGFDSVISFFGSTPSHHLLVFSGLALIFGINFTRAFVQSKRYTPRLDIAMRVGMLISMLHVLAFISPLQDIMGPALGTGIDLTILISCSLMIVSTAIAMRSGSVMAKFYVLSWLFFFSGLFTWFAGNYGLVPRSMFTEYSLLWGNFLEMVVISIALAYKLNTLDLERREAEIKASEKERYRRLVKVLSHDMANALSIVMGCANYLTKRMKSLPEKEQSMIDRIGKATTNMAELLERVRTQEAQRGNEDSLPLSSVGLRDVIRECEILFEEQLEKKRIKLDYSNLDPNLKVLAERTTLVNDVISNVVSNAIKFSPEQAKIEFFVEVESDGIVLRVRDQGIGIPKDLIEQFTKTGSIESRRGVAGEPGTGHGMPLIASYMRIYGGTLSLASETKTENSQSGTVVSMEFKKAA